MMGAVEEQIRLVSKIVNGEIHRPEVERELDRIAKQYGEDCFNSYVVTRKPKPWSKEYLEELRALSVRGAGSREFYLYMAEVSDEVHKGVPKWLVIAAGIVIAIALVAVLVFLVNER